MDSFHGQRNEIEMTHVRPRASWTNPFRLKHDTTMQIPSRINTDVQLSLRSRLSSQTPIVTIEPKERIKK
jgi:hypothetical protein